MAIISITIPDNHLEPIKEAFCRNFNYKDEVVNPDYVEAVYDFTGSLVSPATGSLMITNPESKGPFTKRMVTDWMKHIYNKSEASYSGSLAKQSSIDRLKSLDLNQ